MYSSISDAINSVLKGNKPVTIGYSISTVGINARENNIYPTYELVQSRNTQMREHDCKW